MGGGDDLEIIRGDAYYQSYICHIPRSTIELGLNGSLDCLDGMLFPAICDVIRNLSGMWKLQFPDKLVRYFDVPQNFDPEIGGRSTATSWRALRGSVRRGARGPRPGGAARAIARLQREPPAVGAPLRPARREPWKVPTTSSTWCCAPAVLLPGRSTPTMLPAYGDGVRTRRRAQADGPGARAGDRLVLRAAAAGPDQDARALRLLHRRRRLRQVHRWIRGDVATEGDPLENLVSAFLAGRIATARPATSTTERRGRTRWSASRTAGPRACSSARRASATRRCSTSRCASRPSRRPAFPWTASSTPRTPASSRSSASRRAPSPTRSSSGAERMHGTIRHRALKDDSQERQKRMIAEHFDRLAARRTRGEERPTPSCRAT